MFSFEFMPALLAASVVTLKIMALATLFTLAFAFPVGIARALAPQPWRTAALVIIEFFRGVSALILLFWLFFALPLLGISLSPMTCAVLGLGLNAGAYGAEIVRTGIESVARGQVEAAIALNFPRGQRLWHIVLPQAIALILPPFGNLMIELLKSTALVSMITITDLTFRAAQLNATTLRTGEIFIKVLLIYFVMALAITGLVRLLEARFRRHLGGA
jgi:polar amino acid transport system permease protein